MKVSREKPKARRNRGSSLGLGRQSIVQLIEKVKAGFDFDAVKQFERSTRLPLEVVADAVQIPVRTLNRRKQQGRLQPVESERLLRASAVFERAVDLFAGDVAAATRWLQTPQPALSGACPLYFARTEIGARAVEDLIGRLEHGVFT